MDYDIVVFFGRFRPYHKSHHQIIQLAATRGKHVLVLAGSAGEPRTTRNPFTYAEVYSYIVRSNMDLNDTGRLLVRPMFDVMYNDEQWVSNAHEEVGKTALRLGISKPRVALIGLNKGDGTGYYLDLFPTWDSIDVELGDPRDYTLNATDIRREYYMLGEQMLRTEDEAHLSSMTPAVREFLSDFMREPTYKELCKAFEHNLAYQIKLQGNAQFPVQINTADVMAVQSGHVLLVERKDYPGKGLWALPGGFVEPTERRRECAIRELNEETGIKLNYDTLKLLIKDDASKEYDHPYRDERGRAFTRCYLAHLHPGPLLKLQAGSDAKQAKWVKLSDVRRDQMFSDHYHIIQDQLGKL